jgi:hypothetical protein
LTLAGTYALSGVLGRRTRARSERSPGPAAAPVPVAPSRRHRVPIRTPGHASRSPDDSLIEL